jgi:hypothetical protein
MPYVTSPQPTLTHVRAGPLHAAPSVAPEPTTEPQRTSPTPPPRPVVVNKAHRLSQRFVQQIQAFYQRHPGYAGWAQQHHKLNKAVMISAVIATVTSPLWLRGLVKEAVKRGLPQLPKPDTWRSGLLVMLGLTGLITAAAELKRHLSPPPPSLPPSDDDEIDLPPLLLP